MTKASRINIPNLEYVIVYPLCAAAGRTPYYLWSVSDRDRVLVQWLIDHVGPAESDLGRLPLYGKGWIISEGHNEDPHIADYHYRKMPSGANYVPKGKYGFWLEIDDSHAAILKLNGLLGK
jgi:hypothetical protein